MHIYIYIHSSRERIIEMIDDGCLMNICYDVGWYLTEMDPEGTNEQQTSANHFLLWLLYGASSLHRIKSSLEINETSPPFRGWRCLKI